MNALGPLLTADDVTAAPGIHDPLTARIAAQAGHKALYLGGNAMALGLGKGQPFLTLSETVTIVSSVARATSLPLFVDAGAGFGEGAHLDLAIRDLEAAGATGLHIDDQPYPKPPSYHRGKGAVVDSGQMAARLRTAAAARRDPEFPIVARTDALRVTGSLDETLARCRIYAEAGADALMVLDLGPEQAAAVRAAVPGLPLVWIGGVAPPIPTLAALGAAGFALACYPFNGVAGISVMLADLWRGLVETGTIDQSDEILARARGETLALSGLQRAFDIEDGNGAA